jgi:hypothetical protein
MARNTNTRPNHGWNGCVTPTLRRAPSESGAFDDTEQRADGIHDWPIQTELIKPWGPWRSLAELELATAEWVDW